MTLPLIQLWVMLRFYLQLGLTESRVYRVIGGLSK